MKHKVAVILGSGFSRAAGLPLLREIFSSVGPSFARSAKVRERYNAVKAAWEEWSAKHPLKDPELWLRYLYRQEANRRAGEVSFTDATNYLLASLVRIDTSAEKAAYVHGITKSIDSDVHQWFWMFILARYDLTAVVTMNYDILAEQGLRGTYHARKRSAPLCYYAGLDRPQIVRRMRDPARGKYEPVELTGNIPLCKMHGSVNWALECDSFMLHEDVRAACRVSAKAGAAAVIPPLPEIADLPLWAIRVWDAAKHLLSAVDTWIVCGYSLPDYDVSLRRFFAQAGASVRNLRICLLDPDADNLHDRWQAIMPDDAAIFCLPGIPRALEPASADLWRKVDGRC